ncbi:hypothetical protein ONV78_29005 [Hahella sp. CR1]|uniref:hypothetical protein n=1 Tax=Hahella sp. CR1 TaxID=2992807 RepID=UPI002442B96C|nr:hypothetical protein [Hahella sp. CR1]MDG9671810.1 hypothetical protein [Hahella sp. CR1]
MNSDELGSKEKSKESIGKVASECPITSADESGLDAGKSINSLLDKADEAYQRAEDTFEEYLDTLSPAKRVEHSMKCVAADGYIALSGYQENKPAPFVNVNGEQSLDFLQKHTKQSPDENAVKEYKVRGHYSDKGVKGKHFATHSEKQLLMLHHMDGDHRPIGVTRDQCGDCREAFQSFAYHNDVTVVVRDPNFYRIYQPSGMVEVYDLDRKLVHKTSVDKNGMVEPPSASTVAAHYTGRPW